MTRTTCRPFSLFLPWLVLSHVGGAQAVPATPPFAMPFHVPASIGKAHLHDSSFVGDAMAYSYRGPKIAGCDIYVWPLPADRDMDAGRRDSLLQLEVAKFKEVVPLGIERGWYENYQIAFADPHPVATKSDSVPGYVVALVFARRGQRFTSFFYIYALQGMFIKIRLTVPADDWGSNPALDLPAALVRALDEQR